MRYRPEQSLVLKGISFRIDPGEQVGIIGRTGVGKSSIAQALFRTTEICRGIIEIDGRNLRHLGLHTVCTLFAVCGTKGAKVILSFGLALQSSPKTPSFLADQSGQ